MTTTEPSIGVVAARRLGLVAAAAGAILLFGFIIDPRRAWTGWLLGFVTLVELALAGLLFLALLEVTAARWADALRPVATAMGGALPAAALAGALLLLGVPTLYEWAHAPAHDELLARKAAWLNVPGFALRLIGCFAVWLVLARALRRRLAPPITPGAPRASRIRLAAGFVAAFAITWSLASIDWIQSLEPHWYSTVFALRTATGLVVSGLAAATVLVILLRDHGALRGRITTDHLHDLGKLLLSFTVLWVYVWYCQYMLIWYTDIPEEAVYFARRANGGWRWLTWTTIALGFVAPFLALLAWPARRSPAVLLRVAFTLLVAQALDLYGMIGPPLAGAEPTLGLFEIAGFVAAGSLFFALACRGLASARPAAGDVAPPAPLVALDGPLSAASPRAHQSPAPSGSH